MADPIRAALERLVELDKYSLTLRSKPATKEWADAIAAARTALAEPVGGGECPERQCSWL